MKKIDNIRQELEKGYILTISGVGSKFYGIITLKPSEYVVTGCEEVEVNNIMKQLPGIQETLKWYHTVCQISYDYETRTILGQIKKMKTEGPYCENCIYEVVDDYEVRSDDIFMALIDLNGRIVNKDLKDKNKEKVKVKNGE